MGLQVVPEQLFYRCALHRTSVSSQARPPATVHPAILLGAKPLQSRGRMSNDLRRGWSRRRRGRKEISASSGMLMAVHGSPSAAAAEVAEAVAQNARNALCEICNPETPGVRLNSA